ncbi:MAG: methionine--tRNA ligase [Chitinivibrionales bacterium]
MPFDQDESTGNKRTLLVTSALPYANGDIHLGHLVEVVQTDMYVRFQKMLGNRVLYVCADDTHGTPIELSALKKKITPEQLIQDAWDSHVRDYSAFSIGFDIFYSTNSPENREYAEYIYKKLREKDLVVSRTIKQYFCEHDKRFLPDRFITGICPKCGAKDQYGDVCESCGATYETTDLVSPACIICGNVPEIRESEHFFVSLDKREEFLRNYIGKGTAMQEDMSNFVMHWIDEGLREWCISRDGPYFGFKIPDTENKFFYVWLDAPIGYISSTAKWCKDNGVDVDEFWKKDAAGDVVHFIGKDIVYFHALFWPVMLDAAEFKLPSRIFVHGFLTVQGEKMSKSRGTFILARDYKEKIKHPLACEYLRFYYGAKLSSHAGDIDLNFEEFCNRVNTMLVNNIGNLHHRTFVFMDRYFQSTVPDTDWDEAIAEETEKAAEAIRRHIENVEFKSAVEKIHALGSIGNKYYQDTNPWELVKKDMAAAEKVMVTCANLVKALAVFLKPIVPNLIKPVEEQFGKAFAWDDYHFSVKGMTLGKTQKLVQPILLSEFDDILKGMVISEEKEQAPETPQIEIDDFAKVSMKVGTVIEVQKVKKSNKLLKLKIDDGEKKRQIISGIAQHYTPEQLINMQVVFVANLKPAKLMGELSEGMVLAAQQDDGKLVLVAPADSIEPGAEVS